PPHPSPPSVSSPSACVVRVLTRGRQDSTKAPTGWQGTCSAGLGLVEGGAMHIIGQILFGLVVGILAKLLMPGRDPGGIIVTALIGMAGALVGGFVGRAIWGPAYTAGWIMAILGSIALLAPYRVFPG